MLQLKKAVIEASRFKDWQMEVYTKLHELWSRGQKTRYAADEVEKSITSTSGEVLKEFTMAVVSAVGNRWSSMDVIVEGCVSGGQTMFVGVKIDGEPCGEIVFTETSYTLKYTNVNISSLSDGTHSVQLVAKVTGGTGYVRLMEFWVR